MPGKLKSKISIYRYTDLYILLMLAFIIMVNLLGMSFIPGFYNNVASNFLFGVFIIWIIRTEDQITKKNTITSSAIKNVVVLSRNLYYFLAILLIYTQFQVLIKTFHPVDYDLMLAKWDIWIFGMNAGDIMKSFANPILTEYLQIAYSTFYFLPLTVAVEVFSHHDDTFDKFTRNIIFTYFFSYFLYLILPAIGPRFFVYDFNKLNLELPGLYLTNFLRDAINFGGGVTDPGVNPATIVNRDCMPSGHTMVTLVNIFWAYKLRVKSRHIVMFLGLSIIIATVYMRYHYFVDILAGILFGIVALWLEPIFHNIFKKVFKYEKN